MDQERVVSLTNVEQLDRLLAGPEPVLLFKHSTICPVSAHAHREFVSWLDATEGRARPRAALVRVREERPVSNAIAERLDVAHQSPQAILVVGGKAAWHASHDRITRGTLAEATGTADA